MKRGTTYGVGWGRKKQQGGGLGLEGRRRGVCPTIDGEKGGHQHCTQGKKCEMVIIIHYREDQGETG